MYFYFSCSSLSIAEELDVCSVARRIREMEKDKRIYLSPEVVEVLLVFLLIA